MSNRHSDSRTLRLLKTDALIALGRLDEAGAVVGEIDGLPGAPSAAVAAEIDRVKGDLLSKLGEGARGRRHLARAVRMLDVVGSAAARKQAREAQAREAAARERPERLGPGVRDAAALLDLSPHPELLGREALALVAELDCAKGAALVVARNGRALEVVAQHGWTPREARRRAREAEANDRLALGETRGRRYSLALAPADDVAARDVVGAVRHLVAAALELEAGRRREREEASLLPADTGDTSAVFLSDEMLKLVSIARRVAESDLPVLITGETGTGKEVLARLIHDASGRADKTFLAFNCTGLPRETAESQLFGHRRGAFTDAREEALGVIRGAGGGTLMLDEIGELDPSIQPKLLRFLESGEIHPLGEPRPVSADVRVVAATNVAIDELVREGRFREDLFYRLNVIRLQIPPLRERREEIPPLVRHFLRRYEQEMQRGQLELSQEALTSLLIYDWPGNVRQLANEIRRIVAMAEADETIDPHHLSPEIRAAGHRHEASGATSSAGGPDALSVRIDQPLGDAIEQLERAMIHRAVRKTGGRVNAAAKLLGLSRKGLFLKRRRLGIDVEAVA